MAKESFDLEAVYDAEVAPLMTKLIEVCKANKIPFFATFLYANNEDEGEDGVCTSFSMPEERPIPETFLNLRNFARRPAPLRLRVTNKEGIVTDETVIYP